MNEVSCPICGQYIDVAEVYEQGRADKYQEIVSQYMLLTEKQVAEIRTDAIDEFIEEMKKEPFSDYVMDIVYHIAERLKEQSND